MFNICCCFFILHWKKCKFYLRRTFGHQYVFLIWIIGRSIQDISSGFFLEGFYFLLLTIVSFICLYNLIKNHNDFLIALKTILIGASLVSILGIFEEITRGECFLISKYRL